MLKRIRYGLALILALIILNPGDRISYPLAKWGIYSNPSEIPALVESPALVLSLDGRVDTVFAVQLFTAVEFRLSEKVIRGAFDGAGGERAANRNVIVRRLRPPVGTEIEGFRMQWMLDFAGDARLMRRERPTRMVRLGRFSVDETVSP